MATKLLSEISTNISSGLTPLRSNPEFWDNGTISWLKTEQLGEKYIYETNEHISKAALDKTSIKIFPENSLSIAMYGEGKTRGNLSILKKPMSTNQACCNVVIDPDKADFEYVYYFLKTQYEELRNLSSGVRKNLNSNDIKNYPIRLPANLDKQKKIANVLKVLDTKIEINNRINTELEAMAKTLYDYWFVQFDFPDANGKPYKVSGGKMVYNDTLKREIPEGWLGGCASDIFHFNPTTSLNKGCIAKYIDMDSLPVNGFMTKRPKEKEFTGGVKFVKNDVAVARITPCLENGKTALLSRLEQNEIGFGSTEFIILRGRNASLFGFASCLSRSKSFRQFAISNMTGTSGRKRIDAKVLETYSLAIPPKELLERFEEAVNTFFEKMTANSIENDELSDLRDWLLPMLMNGQVTVNPSARLKIA